MQQDERIEQIARLIAMAAYRKLYERLPPTDADPVVVAARQAEREWREFIPDAEAILTVVTTEQT